jgi:hypothetical protein
MSHSTTAADREGAGLGDDLDSVPTYRPMSTAAVLALVLGLASPLALAWSVLWVIPLVGVLVSAVALRAIRMSEGTLAGRWAALAGLGLSLFIGSCALASHYARDRTVASQGTPWGLMWCELLLEGKAAEALELKQDPMTRRPLGTLKEFYQNNESARQRLAEFREEELVKLLLAAPEGSKVAVGPVDHVEPSRGGYVMVLAFTLHPGRTKDELPSEYEHPQEFSVQLRKSPDRGPIKGAWSVEGYRLGRLGTRVQP